LLESPDLGNIYIDGIDITNISKAELRKIRQQVGVIFQGFNLLNSKTVFDNVALPLKLIGKLTKAQIRGWQKWRINIQEAFLEDKNKELV
jgi:ABC-type methionine transport system ATPase subunit